MQYVIGSNWTYYIGGSGNPTTQVTPFSEYSIDQSGNIILFFCIITYLSN